LGRVFYSKFFVKFFLFLKISPHPSFSKRGVEKTWEGEGGVGISSAYFLKPSAYSLPPNTPFILSPKAYRLKPNFSEAIAL